MNLTVELYQTISKANVQREYEHWHASSIADCPRTHYLKRKGVEPVVVPSAALLLRWQAGYAIEEAIRPHIKSLFPNSVSNERLTSENLDLTGEFDNYDPDSETLIEVKSVHDYAFKEHEGETYLKKKVGEKNGKNIWGPMLTPYLHHEIQNHSYYMLCTEKGIEVERIIYVYVSLSGRIVTYETKIQKELLNNIDKRLKVLGKAWKDQTPPECICKPEHPLFDSVMQYCPYKTENGCCDLSVLEAV